MTNQVSALSPFPLWSAPTVPVGYGLDTTVVVPGSKSLTNRFLVLAALANGPSTLRGTLISRDSELMIAALEQLGAKIVAGSEPGEFNITPIVQGQDVGTVTLDCGLAGTVMRFIPAVAALVKGTVIIDGDEAARVRPMAPIIDGLRALGVTVSQDNNGFLPITVEATGEVPGGEIVVDASGSSQFVSGLLLAAPRFKNGVTLRHEGESVPSMPHVDMTVEVLQNAGAAVSRPSAFVWTVLPGPVEATDIHVEPDLSNATPFMAAALVAGGTVRIPGWPTKTTQPGALAAQIFERMGATCTLTGGVMSVTGNGTIHGLGHLDLSAAGELAPTFAALAVLADAPTEIHGIAHLRGHETDRLAALTAEINSLGGHCEETPNGLIITPAPLHPGVFHTYHDHRMATAGTIIGLRYDGIEIENVGTTAKTVPGFDKMWHTMLGTPSGVSAQ